MSGLKRWHAVIMITGTSVGTGVLGLPIISSQAGFVPTVCAFIVAWIFMTKAALYILDVKMHYRSHYNLSSLIKLTLGQVGHYVSSTMIIVLLYALLCTYMMTGAAWFKILCGSALALSLPWVTVLFVLLFGSLIFLKERILYGINHWLGIGLCLAFSLMIGLSLWPIDLSLIQYSNPPAVLTAMPLLLTTFGFSIVVPTVTEYLEYDAKAITFAIIVGSLIAFIAYLIWEWVTLGHISMTGSMGFNALNQNGDDGTGVIHAFAAATHNPWATQAGKLFAIFADITSFLGVSLALMHCFNDLMIVKSSVHKRLLVIMLTFVPPLLITLLYPKAFIEILSFAGLSVALLLGLFPALMKVSLYYRKQTQALDWTHLLSPQLMMIFLTAIFFLGVIGIEMFRFK